MTLVQKELESFTKFAHERLDAGKSPQSIDELYDEWRESHASVGVAASLRDMEAGETGRDFESFANDFRRQNGVTDDQ